MVQQEVAQRIVAKPGDLSLLAVSIQFYGEPRIIASVPAGAFFPAPKVDSAILRIDVHNSVPLDAQERDGFFRMVQAGYAEKRKQLHNALSRGLHWKDEDVRMWLASASIDATRRAETLSIDDWLKLWQQYPNPDVL